MKKNNKTTPKRGLALFLALMMCLSLLQVPAFAVDTPEESGSGTSRDDPKIEVTVKPEKTDEGTTTTTTTEKTWGSSDAAAGSETTGKETTIDTVVTNNKGEVVNKKEEVKGEETTTTVEEEPGEPVPSPEDSTTPDPDGDEGWTPDGDAEPAQPGSEAIDVDLEDLENKGEIEVKLPISPDKPLGEGESVSGSGTAAVETDKVLDKNSALAKEYNEYAAQLTEGSDAGKTITKDENGTITVKEDGKTTVLTKTENGYTKTVTTVTAGTPSSPAESIPGAGEGGDFNADKAVVDRLAAGKAEAEKTVGETTENGVKTTIKVVDVANGYQVITEIVRPDGSTETTTKTVTGEAEQVKITETTEMTKTVETSKEELSDVTGRKATVTIDGVSYESIDQWVKDFDNVTLKYVASGPETGIKIKKTDGKSYVTHEFYLESTDSEGKVTRHTVYCSDLNVLVNKDEAYTKILLDDLRSNDMSKGEAGYLTDSDIEQIKAIIQMSEQLKSGNDVKAALKKAGITVPSGVSDSELQNILIAARQAALWKFAHSKDVEVDESEKSATLKDGYLWWSIAAKYFPAGSDKHTQLIDEMKSQNNPGANNYGDKVMIPVYTVKSGDSLSKIAGAHNMTLKELLKLNPGMKTETVIHPGDNIIVKNGGGVFLSDDDSDTTNWLAKEVYDLFVNSEYEKPESTTPNAAVSVVGSVVTVKGDNKQEAEKIQNSADVALTLKVEKGLLGDLIVIAVNGDGVEVGREVVSRKDIKDGEDVNVKITNIQLGEAGTTNLNFNISGTRELDEKGVYLFVTKGDYTKAQTMIGVENKQEHFNMNFDMTIKVEEAAANLNTSGSSQSFSGEKKDVSYRTDLTITTSDNKVWNSMKEETFTPDPGGSSNENDPEDPKDPPKDPETPPVDIPDEDPPLVEIPDEDPPLVDIPEEDPPLVDIPEEDPPLVDIPDPSVPKVPAKPPVVDIPDPDVPLVDIPDEDVPLADVPATGDNSGLWMALSLMACTGLVYLFLEEKKRQSEAK